MSTETNPESGERHTPPDDDIAGYVPGDEYDDEETAADDLAPVEAEAGAAHDPALPFVSIDWESEVNDAGGKLGAEVIQALSRRLPNAPGVYRMLNAAGDVLYVGKARNLKKRVTNYAHGRFHTLRIGRMVRDTATMEFVVTRTETEALLLEANLIKRLRPRFNVLLRDDKSFPYILLTGDHPSPGDLQAPRRAIPQGRLFRPVRVGRRGRADDQFTAARLSAADLHRFGVRNPDAALPALSDQALLGSVHGRDQPGWI